MKINRHILALLTISIIMLSGCEKNENDDPLNEDISIPIITTLSREDISSSSRPIIIDNEDYFGTYIKYAQSNIISVSTWQPGLVTRTLYVRELDFPSHTFIKFKGVVDPESQFGTNGFTIASTDHVKKVNISPSIREISDSIVIALSDTLSKIDYTTLLNTGDEIKFQQDSIIASIPGGVESLDSEGLFLHTIYEGPNLDLGIVVHIPFIDCVYNLSTDKVEHILVYVYGYALE